MIEGGEKKTLKEYAMSFQHQQTAAVRMPGAVIFGFVAVVFIQHYINLHYAVFFFNSSNVLCLHNHLAYLKSMNEMRSPVKKTPTKSSSWSFLVHKLANGENPIILIKLR